MEAITGQLRESLPFVLDGRLSAGSLIPAVERDPRAFWSALVASLERSESVVLMDANWPEKWKRHAFSAATGGSLAPGPCILIPTSGSTGLPKFCIHNLETLGAAAQGYRERFGRQGVIHSVNLLPQHHVGGLMPVFRSAVCAGKVQFADYRRPSSFNEAPFPLAEASLSVVPTQLRRLLADRAGRDVLRAFAVIFVGGASCPADLLESARREGIRLAPCYGATETAAMVTALDPEDFLAGVNGVGTPLPHATVDVDSSQRIRIRAASITLGYLPGQPGFSRNPCFTGDLGQIDESGNLHIHGRADRVIITGGENVHPEQVEMAAMRTGLVSAARCLGIPDPDWGQRVELEVVSAGQSDDIRALLKSELSRHLPACAIPKQIYLVEHLTPMK